MSKPRKQKRKHDRRKSRREQERRYKYLDTTFTPDYRISLHECRRCGEVMRLPHNCRMCPACGGPLSPSWMSTTIGVHLKGKTVYVPKYGLWQHAGDWRLGEVVTRRRICRHWRKRNRKERVPGVPRGSQRRSYRTLPL